MRRRFTADFTPDPEPGHVSLFVGLYRQSGGHGKRRDRAGSDTNLFRCAFMPRHPSNMALLRDLIAEHGCQTLARPATAGPAAHIALAIACRLRKLMRFAAPLDSLNHVEFRTDDNFGFDVPVAVPAS